MKIAALVVASILLVACFLSAQWLPKAVVPDSETAVKIAEAVLVPVYGKQTVESERPFKAKLKGEIWTVGGTLHCPDGHGGITTHCVGGWQWFSFQRPTREFSRSFTISEFLRPVFGSGN